MKKITHKTGITIALTCTLLITTVFFIDPTTSPMLIRLFPFAFSGIIVLAIVESLLKSLIRIKKGGKTEAYVRMSVFVCALLWVLYSVNQLTIRDTFVFTLLAVLFTTYVLYMSANNAIY